jgi:hypothetical protein
VQFGLLFYPYSNKGSKPKTKPPTEQKAPDSLKHIVIHNLK